MRITLLKIEIDVLGHRKFSTATKTVAIDMNVSQRRSRLDAQIAVAAQSIDKDMPVNLGSDSRNGGKLALQSIVRRCLIGDRSTKNGRTMIEIVADIATISETAGITETTNLVSDDAYFSAHTRT